MKEYTVYRLVKGEDLNHHGTLFAGRTAEWFVESSFVAAASSASSPENIVCINIHGMQFKSPIRKGDIICFKSKIAYVGKTSIIVYTQINSETKQIVPVEGFLSFIHVDSEGNKIPHHLTMDDATDEEEIRIREQAKKLAKR